MFSQVPENAVIKRLMARLAAMRATEVSMLAEFPSAPAGLEKVWDEEQEGLVRAISRLISLDEARLGHSKASL